MLTLLLFFCSIPYTPRITLSDDHVDIVAPSDVCHDVILAVGDVIEPGWRNQPFPVWVDNANKGKETNRIFFSSYAYYGDVFASSKELEEFSYYFRQLVIGLTLVRCKLENY